MTAFEGEFIFLLGVFETHLIIFSLKINIVKKTRRQVQVEYKYKYKSIRKKNANASI